MHGFKQRQGCRCVVTEVNLWLFHALASFNQCGKMHDSIKPLSERSFQQRPVGKFTLDKSGPVGQHGAVTMAKIVVDDYLVAPHQ